MSFYDGSVPVFIRSLTTLSAIIAKAEAYAAENNIAPNELLEARLHPTMYPLTRQIQMACDFAGKACARFTQTDLPVMPNKETTFAELQARIRTVLGNIEALPAAKYEGAETREIEFPIGPGKTLKLTGQQFLNRWSFPQFFFHYVTVYDILRHKGVDLGKNDYINLE